MVKPISDARNANYISIHVSFIHFWIKKQKKKTCNREKSELNYKRFTIKKLK